MNLPVIILGAGGHGKVLADMLRLSGCTILGYTDTNDCLHGQFLEGLPVLGPDEFLSSLGPTRVRLANGIGSTISTTYRKVVYRKFSGLDYKFVKVIHPSTTVALSAELDAGVQVMAGVVIQPGVSIKENSVVNTGALVDHDCSIGKHVHIGPGVTISGGVILNDCCHVGTGASIVQGVTVGACCFIAAGSVVTKDVPEGFRVAGAPAKRMAHP